MSWIDLLRMSASNLKRRKLRTFLTVLGVVIGTASIVVMVSLGLGLQKSVYDEMEQSGGLTTINVTGSESVGDGMMHSSNSDNSDEASKYIDDNCCLLYTSWYLLRPRNLHSAEHMKIIGQNSNGIRCVAIQCVIYRICRNQFHAVSQILGSGG